MKLLSMTKFVLDQFRQLREKDLSNIYLTAQRIEYYAKFLEQPLILGMFVPCQTIGNDLIILEKPKDYESWQKDGHRAFNFSIGYNLVAHEYQEAKDRVLFEGFVFYKDDKESFCLDLVSSDGSETFWFMKNENVEDLLGFDHEFILTESAKKNLGL